MCGGGAWRVGGRGGRGGGGTRQRGTAQHCFRELSSFCVLFGVDAWAELRRVGREGVGGAQIAPRKRTLNTVLLHFFLSLWRPRCSFLKMVAVIIVLRAQRGRWGAWGTRHSLRLSRGTGRVFGFKAVEPKKGSGKGGATAAGFPPPPPPKKVFLHGTTRSMGRVGYSPFFAQVCSKRNLTTSSVLLPGFHPF